MNKVLKSVLIVSSLSLLGAACAKTTNTNVNTTQNTNVSMNTNLDVNTNVSANLNVAVNTNSATNTNTSTVDMSDWLTYTDDKFGFSFKHPKEWALSTNDAGLSFLQNNDSSDISVRAKIFVSENVVETGMDDRAALKFEDGREPLQLISEEFLSINELSSYRAFRQLKKGEPIFTGDELNEITRTEIEYTYLYEDDLFRIWFTIDGENSETVYDIVDAIGQSFSI